MSIVYYSSPVGILEIKSTESHITQLLFKECANTSSENIPAVMKECIRQLDEYFSGNRKDFYFYL